MPMSGSSNGYPCYGAGDSVKFVEDSKILADALPFRKVGELLIRPDGKDETGTDVSALVPEDGVLYLLYVGYVSTSGDVPIHQWEVGLALSAEGGYFRYSRLFGTNSSLHGSELPPPAGEKKLYLDNLGLSAQAASYEVARLASE